VAGAPAVAGRSGRPATLTSMPAEPARRLLLIGIGAGDPRLVTFEAAEALRSADVFFVFDKGGGLADLRAPRDEILARHASPGHRLVEIIDPARDLERGSGYGEAVASWHAGRADLLRRAVVDGLAAGGVGAFLVWGDPSLYDSTLRVVEEVVGGVPWPVTVEVVPGVSSLHLLTARHRIPLNRVGAAVRITTGRRLAEVPPDAGCDVVVFLDGGCAFTGLDDEHLDIYWGAYLGTPDELLVAGALRDRKDEIVKLRAEARARKGWMFDTYLLRWRG
jgi:precorrin-6A synthase